MRDITFFDNFFKIICENINDKDIESLKSVIDPSAEFLEPKCLEYIINPLSRRRFPYEKPLNTEERISISTERLLSKKDPFSEIGRIASCIEEFIGVESISASLSPWMSVYLLSLQIYRDAIEPTVENDNYILTLTKIAVNSDNNLLIDVVIRFYIFVYESVKDFEEYESVYLVKALCIVIKLSISKLTTVHAQYESIFEEKFKDYEIDDIWKRNEKEWNELGS